MILFSLLLGDFFDQERRHEKDKQPSVFAKKGDSLTGRAKHKASDRAHQAGEDGAYLFAQLFQAITNLLANGFYTICSSTCPICEYFRYNTNRYANGSNNGCKGEAAFLEEIF